MMDNPGALDKKGAGVRAGGGRGEKGKHEQRAIHSGISGKGYEPQVRASSDFVTAAFAESAGVESSKTIQRHARHMFLAIAR